MIPKKNELRQISGVYTPANLNKGTTTNSTLPLSTKPSRNIKLRPNPNASEVRARPRLRKADADPALPCRQAFSLLPPFPPSGATHKMPPAAAGPGAWVSEATRRECRRGGGRVESASRPAGGKNALAALAACVCFIGASVRETEAHFLPLPPTSHNNHNTPQRTGRRHQQ